MSITSQIDRTKDLTIFKVTGVLSFDMAVPVVEAFYNGDPTSHVLWDLIDTTGIQFTSEEVLEIVRFKPRYEGKRNPGKTAPLFRSFPTLKYFRHRSWMHNGKCSRM